MSVDVGARGAIRRLAKGVVPAFTLRALLEKIPPRVIPWQCVDLLETRSGAPRQAEDRVRRPRRSCTRPTSPTSSKTWRPPSAKRSSRRSTRRWPPRRSKRSIPSVQGLDRGIARLRPRRRHRRGDGSRRRCRPARRPAARTGPEKILEEMEPEERQDVDDLLEFGEHTPPAA